MYPFLTKAQTPFSQGLLEQGLSIVLLIVIGKIDSHLSPLNPVGHEHLPDSSWQNPPLKHLTL